MTDYIDFEVGSGGDAANREFDIIIIGGGAAGLTLTRELAGQGIRIAVLESGGLSETEALEQLNEVDVAGTLQGRAVQDARREWHGPQMTMWTPEIQRFGVRCRTLGGSTAAWAGKVAPFDALDYEARPWIPAPEWPVGSREMQPYIKRAAVHLDLGPVVQGQAFWKYTPRGEPAELSRLQHFGAFFWQFARSRHALTDVMRFGPDFLKEDHEGVTVFLNATATALRIETGGVTGVQIASSLTGRHGAALKANLVVLAAGAIENARLLLLSKDGYGQPLGETRDAIGRYLMDHPSIQIGEFNAEERTKASTLLGFYPVQQHYRVYMYACGLTLNPDFQRDHRMPNMAAFTGVVMATDDPLKALSRLATGKSRTPTKDIIAVVRNLGVVITAIGRKLLNYRRIPQRLRRLIADVAVFLDANIVAREYVARGRGRRLEQVTLNVISEQPPSPDNRVTLADRVDRLGQRLARIQWDVSTSLRQDIVRFAALLREDIEKAGIGGFSLSPAFETGDISQLVIHDMAHTAGTTRMGLDPSTSVVDASLQVHGIPGLYVAGASVFPTSGHANPTLVIMALAIRLADKIKDSIVTARLESLGQGAAAPDASGPLILVTGASGNLGHVVVEQLLARGFRVRGQFRNTLPSDPRIQWMRRDFADPHLSDATFDDLLDGVSAVIHLAGSFADAAEMEAANVTNVDNLARACARHGVRYFGQASSMVVYGSPSTRMVTESTPIIDLKRPVEKQYLAQPRMRDYARTKVAGEAILSRYGDRMHIDIYRIAVAKPLKYLNDSLGWSKTRAVFCLYRNSHFLSPRIAARAIVHLMEKALDQKVCGVEIYNIADTASPTFAAFYSSTGRKPGLHIPLVVDLLAGMKSSRSFALRWPMGWFRLDNSKLRATGFVLNDQDGR